MISKTKKSTFALFPFFLVFYEVSTYLANDMYLPALPSIMQDFNINAHAVQMTLMTWFFGAASMQLVLGPVSDRIGRRPVLLGGGVVFIISTIICAISTNIYTLLMARFFQGGAVCSVATAGYSSIHECYDQTKAVHILALMGSITVLAPAFGPLLGSLILELLHWRWIFGVLAIWGMIGIIALWKWMPESNPTSQRHLLDWRVLLNNYYKICLNPRFIGNTLIFCLSFLGMITWLTGGPFLIIYTLKRSPFFFGMLQTIIFGGLIVAAQLVKHIMDRVGVKRLVHIGLLVMLASGAIAFCSTLFFPDSLFGLVFALTLFAFGSGLVFGPTSRLAVEACSEPMGARMAVSSTILSLFGVFGSFLASVTYTGALNWFGSLLFIASALAFLMGWLLRKR